MHDHDFDLIAQLAEGSLLGDDVRAARFAVESCVDCRTEFESQTFILEELSDVEPARMSEFERARLHRAVVEATMAGPGERHRSSPVMSWMPKLAVAAAAVAFVGVIGFGLNSSRPTGDNTAAEATSLETAELDGRSLAADDAAVAEEAAAAGAADEAFATAESPTSKESESLAELTEGMVAVQPQNLGVIDRDSFADLAFERLSPGEVPDRAADQRPIEPFPFACVGAAVGPYGEEEALNLAGVAVLDGQVVEILGFGDEVFAFDPKTCDLVARETLSP